MAVSSVGMLGEGITQGRPVVVPIHVARPALHRHDLELGAEARCSLNSRASSPTVMPWRIGMRIQPDEGFVARLQRRTFDRDAADRIGAVADDDGDAGARGGAQAIGHGVDEGVDARADILDVDHEHVDQRQHLRGRLARLAVEREDRHVAARILRVRRLDHVVLQVRAEAVLRTEDRGERPVRRGGEPIDDMAEVTVDRGGIGEHADAQAVQARRGEQPFGAEQHGSGAVARKGGRPGNQTASLGLPRFQGVLLYGRKPAGLKLRSCYGSRRRGRQED